MADCKTFQRMQVTLTHRMQVTLTHRMQVTLTHRMQVTLTHRMQLQVYWRSVARLACTEIQETVTEELKKV
jgi:hypothetical protein